MRGGSASQWLFLAALVLGVLVNLLIRWIRERGHETSGNGAPAAPRQVPAPAPSPTSMSVPAAPRPAASPAPSSEPRRETGRPVARGRRPRRPFDLGRETMRQAIVLMAVLGPCRAVAPQGPDAIPVPPP